MLNLFQGVSVGWLERESEIEEITRVEKTGTLDLSVLS